MRRRLVRLIVFSIVASVIASLARSLGEKVTATQHDAADAGAPGSVDHWPEVPKNPEAGAAEGSA